MGWPPCQSCDAWPAVGYTYLCGDCLKDPAKVKRQMRHDFDERSKLRAENERLRKAAQAVLKHGAIDEDCHYIRELAAALSGLSESDVNDGKAFDQGDG